MSARITEAMVEAALVAYFEGDLPTGRVLEGCRESMVSALAAALSTEAAPVAWLRRRDIDGPCNAIPAWKTQSDGADVAVYTAPISTEPGEAEGKVARVLANPCIEKLQDDEPFFVLLGRDKHAAEATRAWAAYREAERGISRKTIEAREIADDMDRFAAAPLPEESHHGR